MDGQWAVMLSQWATMRDGLLQSEEQTHAAQLNAEAANSTAQIADKSFVLSNRPWIKIKHRIVRPLTFDAGGRVGSPIAAMTIEDTLENVGNSVALNVRHWEEIIPMDPNPLASDKSAAARARQYCDAHRHPDPAELQGEGMFPHDPTVETTGMGIEMSRVAQATIHANSGLNGKVGFFVVGCLWYRSSFEPKSAPTHQTRFMYYLGIPLDFGFQPYIFPRGTATELRLIRIPNGYTTD